MAANGGNNKDNQATVLAILARMERATVKRHARLMELLQNLENGVNPRSWEVTEAYAKGFVERVLNNLQSPPVKGLNMSNGGGN